MLAALAPVYTKKYLFFCSQNRGPSNLYFLLWIFMSVVVVIISFDLKINLQEEFFKNLSFGVDVKTVGPATDI